MLKPCGCEPERYCQECYIPQPVAPENGTTSAFEKWQDFMNRPSDRPTMSFGKRYALSLLLGAILSPIVMTIVDHCTVDQGMTLLASALITVLVSLLCIGVYRLGKWRGERLAKR